MSPEDTVRDYLHDAELDHEEPAPGTFVVQLPGDKKLRTTVSIVVGDHSLSINAFVARHPDENHAELYRWLLERNARMSGVAYSVDHVGDIYLVGRLPLDAVTREHLDGLLGTVLAHADGDFNTILEKGFGSAIAAEWRWRLARGESTRNLEAFRHLAPRD
ncbi:MAG: YbjN domain-containing protein [Candidatus Nanopelagicales bacterium]